MPSDTATLTSREVELLDFLSYIYLQIGEPERAAALLAVRQSQAPATREPETATRAAIALAVARTRHGHPRQALHLLDALAQESARVQTDARYHLARAQALSAAGEHDAATLSMRAYVDYRPKSLAAMASNQQPIS